MAKSESDIEFTTEEIETLLQALNQRLKNNGVEGEICIFGGATMLLAWDAREMTRDVDATIEPDRIVKDAAREVAHSTSIDKPIPEDWLNDGVKVYIDKPPESEQLKLVFDFSHLRVMRSPGEYLLAMKAQSARIGEEEADTEDLKFLMKKTGIKDPRDVLDLVEKYYPTHDLPKKVELFVKSVAEKL